MVIYHAGFVLSGYLIGGQLLGQLAKGGAGLASRLPRGRFLARRALRILPAKRAGLPT